MCVLNSQSVEYSLFQDSDTRFFGQPWRDRMLSSDNFSVCLHQVKSKMVYYAQGQARWIFLYHLLEQPKFVKIFLILDLWKGLSALYEFNEVKYQNSCYTFFRLVYYIQLKKKKKKDMLQYRILKLRIEGKLLRLPVLSFPNISNCS